MNWLDIIQWIKDNILPCEKYVCVCVNDMCRESISEPLFFSFFLFLTKEISKVRIKKKINMHFQFN